MNLKQIRQKQGITQAEMAQKLGVSRPTYIQIERGKRELTVGQARVISELLQIYKSQESEPKKLKEKIASGNESGKFNHQKFEEVLLYILEKVGAKPNIGETALFKLLYFIDFDFYEKHGQFITGATYMKNHHGP
ncbi:helix-turn-helix domain-containing protein, partial [Candidatus Peregrinibacteria bacterium]|nr:helix-turn-helix domain-containing protein [Candidatus Peregrinibacteria bacterium]